MGANMLLSFSLMESPSSVNLGLQGSNYPKLTPDISYGLAMQSTQEVLVPRRAEARMLIPTMEPVGDWMGADPDFDDDPAATDWRSVTTGIGFGEHLASITETDVGGPMKSVNASALVRIPFELQGAERADALLLNIAHDDGFVAYLNGTRVASANAPDVVDFDASATAENEALGRIFVPDPSTVSILYDFEADGGQARLRSPDVGRAAERGF